jgi:hypothetical protein
MLATGTFLSFSIDLLSSMVNDAVLSEPEMSSLASHKRHDHEAYRCAVLSGNDSLDA